MKSVFVVLRAPVLSLLSVAFFMTTSSLAQAESRVMDARLRGKLTVTNSTSHPSMPSHLAQITGVSIRIADRKINLEFTSNSNSCNASGCTSKAFSVELPIVNANKDWCGNWFVAELDTRASGGFLRRVEVNQFLNIQCRGDVDTPKLSTLDYIEVSSEQIPGRVNIGHVLKFSGDELEK